MVENKILIQSYDVAADGELRLSALQRYFQQAAREDCDSFGATYEALRAKGVAFILSKIRFDISRMPKCDTAAVLKTYSERVDGVIFTRCFELLQDGAELAFGSSEWALINFQRRMPVRSSVLDTPLEQWQTGKSFQFPRRLDTSDAKSIGSRPVYYSDIDQNEHLNNCKYTDIAFDHLPAHLQRAPKSATMIYLSECRQGDILDICTDIRDGRALCEIKNTTTGKSSFEAEFVF